MHHAGPTLTSLVEDRPATPRPARPPAPPPGHAAPGRLAKPPALPVRPEIQALRAIAVAAVVAYHVFPAAVPGGFAGVDVFFAVSGLLITTLLLREAEHAGTISLSGFWARRARRILPAALLTILAGAAATVAFVPVTSWGQFFAELRASALYVQNWHLAGGAVDYFARGDAPSVAQHFWTLSVEEQFYLAWPVLLLAAVRLGGVRLRRAAIAAVMLLVTAASIVYSIAVTESNTAAAYFLTPARAWEFGLGGLLALVPHRRRGGAAPALLSWLGLGAIAAACFAYTDATPFPGYAALLPVLGALAVMGAGMPASPAGPSRALAATPVQFLGDISYAVYLWHWPLVVIAPYALDHRVDTATGLGIVGATLLLATLTKLAVEDPIRRAKLLARRRVQLTFLLAALGTGLAVAVTGLGSAYVDRRAHRGEAATRRVLAEHPGCFGAAARDVRHPCANPALRGKVVPTPIEAKKLPNAPCTVIERAGRVHVCAFGVAPERARATVALVGDSHASHWRAAIDRVARGKRWRGLSVTRTGCPFTSGTPAQPEPARSNCTLWNRQLLQWFARHPEVATVFVASHAGGAIERAGGDQFAAQRAAYAKAWAGLPRSVHHVVVLRDTPKTASATLACVQGAMDAHGDPARTCAVPRERYLDRDPAQAAAGASGADRVEAMDFTPFFCDAAACPPVIGGALVLKDTDHMTPTFAATLAPYFRRKVEALERRWVRWSRS